VPWQSQPLYGQSVIEKLNQRLGYAQKA